MSSSDTKYLIYDKDEIAKRLKEQRKLTGHSQAQLAKKIDALIGKAANQNGLRMDKHAGVEYVSGWENNTRAITLNVLMAYSKIYNVSLDFLMGRTPDWNPENHDIKEKTGLSDKSLVALESIGVYTEDDYKDTIDSLPKKRLLPDEYFAARIGKPLPEKERVSIAYDFVNSFINYMLSSRKLWLDSAFLLLQAANNIQRSSETRYQLASNGEKILQNVSSTNDAALTSEIRSHISNLNEFISEADVDTDIYIYMVKERITVKFKELLDAYIIDYLNRSYSFKEYPSKSRNKGLNIEKSSDS